MESIFYVIRNTVVYMYMNCVHEILCNGEYYNAYKSIVYNGKS